MIERWKPEYGETYYYVWTTGHTAKVVWTNTTSDKNLFERGNCFKTKEEAESASEKVKDLMLSLHGEQATESDQLPKLTAEVFNHPDCPKWAKYAAVDADGATVFFELTPSVSRFGNWWRRDGVRCHQFGTNHDPSNWKNSIIERPEKTTLPDWFTVDAIGWHKRCGYFTVTYIDDVSKRVNIQQVDDKSKGYLSFNTVCNDVMQARIRSYNSEEMQSLVGKIIKHNKNGDCELVLSFHADNKSVETKSWLMMEDTLLREYTINGRQCGVLEHVENGEWVK